MKNESKNDRAKGAKMYRRAVQKSRRKEANISADVMAGITANEARTASEKRVRDMLNELVTGDLPLWARHPRQIMAITLLMAAKLGDKKVLKDDSLIRAKLAAGSVKSTGSLGAVLYLILLAVETNDIRFFIDFGKCLSGDIKDATLFDKRDLDIAEIVLFNPEMSAREAVRELYRRGHHGITEDNFRMWKMRLLKAKPMVEKTIAFLHNKFFPVTVTDDSD
jgi:hypothetical protein